MSTQHSLQRVTIGMPIYNAAPFLAEAFDSLLSQSYADFEIIVSDNASTDETEAICRGYAARDQRIRYVRQNVNRGSTWNFNEVFRLSHTEYFKWAAYDDICASTYLEQCVAVLDQYPDVDWVHSRSRHIDVRGTLLLGDDTPEITYTDGGLMHDGAVEAPTRASDRASDRFRAVLLGHGGCLDSYGLIRSTSLQRTQLFLPCFGSEKVLMAELGLWGKYYEIPQCLFFARIHVAALGSQSTGQLQQNAINPLARGRQFPRLKMLRGYRRAVQRSKLGFAERARCYATIARYLFQTQKWKTILRKSLTDGGISGAYPALPVTPHENRSQQLTLASTTTPVPQNDAAPASIGI